MSTSTNPLSGVEHGVNAAAAKLLEPQKKEETIKEDELEQESDEEETLDPIDELDDGLEPEDEADNEEGDEDPEPSGELDEEVGDDDEEPEADSKEPEYTVTVKGEEYTVNLEELKQGFQRQKDYTQKTAAVAEEKRGLDTVKSELNEERQKYIQMTVALANQQKQKLQIFDEELAELKDVDPVGYVAKKIERDDAEAEINSSLQLAQTAYTQQQHESQERLTVYVQEQDEILKRDLEGWSDPETGVAIKQGIVKFAKTMGYSDEEIGNVVDAKSLMVLNKARLYDELLAKRATIRKKKTSDKANPRIKSSSPRGKSTTKARSVKAKKDQLQRSGKVKDAVSLLMEQMKKK